MAKNAPIRTDFAPAYDPRVVSQYITQAAQARGIDPEIALRVAKSEGLYGYVGDQGSSFGPFQLHYGNVAAGGNKVGGLGDVFTQTTELNARDPSTWKAQVDFALGEAARSGWGPWHGWKGDKWAGIPGEHPRATQSYPQPGQLYETGRFIPQEQPMQYAGMPQRLPAEMLSPQSIAYAQPQAQPAPLYSAPPNQVASAATMNDATPAPAQLTHDNFLDDHFLTQQPIAMKAAPAQPAAAQPAQLSHDNFLDTIGAPTQPTPRQEQKQENVVAPVGPQEWGMGRSFARGASWGLAEPLEVAASIARHGTHGLPLGEAFSKGMENIAKSREAYRLAEPGTSAVAEGLGSAVGVPGMAAARAVGALGKAAAAGMRAVPELAPAAPGLSRFMSGAGGVASRTTRGAVEGAALATAEQAPWMTRPEDRGIGNVLVGAAGGGLGSALLAPLTKAVTLPFQAALSPEAAKIATSVNQKFGLNLRPSQLSENPILKAADDRLIPAGVKNKQFEDWHKAVMKDINATAEKFKNPDMGITGFAKTKVSDAASATGEALDKVVAGTTLKIKPKSQFHSDLNAIAKFLADNVEATSPAHKAFSEAIDKLNANITGNEIKGEAFRDMIKYNHGFISNAFLSKTDPVLKKIGHDLRNALLGAFEVTNPAKRGQYNELATHYKKLLALKNLAKSDLSETINPQGLLKQVGKRNLTGDFGDLAEVGQKLEKEPIAAPSTAYKTVKEYGLPHVFEQLALGLGLPVGGIGTAVNVLQAGREAMRVPQRMALQSPYLAEQVFTGNQTIPSMARGAERFAARLGANALTGYGAPERVR